MYAPENLTFFIIITSMSWFLAGFTAVLLLDAWRLRRRAESVSVISTDVMTAPETCSPETYVVLPGPGVEVSGETVRQATAWAASEQLEVLDLIPGDLGASDLLGLLQTVDPSLYRQSPFNRGQTAGHAMLVKPDVLHRADMAHQRADDPVEFQRLAVRLKRYACRTMDLAIAPQLPYRPTDPNKRKAVINQSSGGLGGFVLTIQGMILGLVASAPLLDVVWGTATLVAFQAQPVLALGGLPIKPKDLRKFTLFRLPMELWHWLETVRGRWQPEATPDPVASRRGIYDDLLKDGLQPFFDPARDTCPICHGENLQRHLIVPDQIQNKPGRFKLDRCSECGHIFQNPALSLQGLEFYYRDFYDGLWEDVTEQIFGFSDKPYHVRARLLEGRHEPKKWLDVGGGYGHFCCSAKDVWPDAQFDCLDLSEGVDEAVRRRWVTHGFRGLFSDLASELAGQYDVVSMSHYLEHVRDPEAELKAAATVLCPDGYLLIEVPDPESAIGKFLGGYWVHWFQPQHQHFLSVENLTRLFEQYGFEATEWHRGEAHRPVDLMSAMVLCVGRIAPDPNRPWRPRATKLAVAKYRITWILALPVVLSAWVSDKLLAPLFRRPGFSNTYRVLAQRRVTESD